jgi:hypothetical protein
VEQLHGALVFYSCNLRITQDVALEEMRIEGFFPADNAARAALAAVAIIAKHLH